MHCTKVYSREENSDVHMNTPILLAKRVSQVDEISDFTQILTDSLNDNPIILRTRSK